MTYLRVSVRLFLVRFHWTLYDLTIWVRHRKSRHVHDPLDVEYMGCRLEIKRGFAIFEPESKGRRRCGSTAKNCHFVAEHADVATDRR